MRTEHRHKLPRSDIADILDALGDAILVLDRESRVLFANKEIYRLLNRNADELIGVPIVDLMPASDGWMFQRYYLGAMINGKPGTFEGFRFADKVFEVRFHPVHDGVAISFHDVTMKRQVDELKTLALFVLDRVYEMVFLVRSDGRLFHVNAEMCRSLGYSLNDLIHMNIFDVEPDLKVDDWHQWFNKIKEDGHIAYESSLRKKDDGLIPVEARANYVLLYGIEYCSVTARDITERKKAEEELRHAHRDLEKKVKERTKELMHEKMEAELYLDLMGHDISNMHQIVIADLQLAQEMMAEDGRLESDEKELIDMPLKVLERSARLVDNVRKLQKLRACDYETKTIDIGSLLADVVDELSKIKGIDVTINNKAGHGYYVMASPLLKDVFSNLIDNAIKHSKGPVIVNIRVKKIVYNGRSFNEVAVEDNGPGIPDANKEKIFNRLNRGQKRGKTKVRGIGLGLYVSKTLVESFLGLIKVEDRVPGDYTKGSRFLVYLPAIKEDNNGK